MKTRQLAKLVCTMLFGLAVGTVLAGALTLPTVRHYGYINGTLNLALVASAEVQAQGATVEVQASTDGGQTWAALAGSGSVVTAFNAWTIDNGGSSNLTLTDYLWKSAAPLTSDISLRYRLVNGGDSSDWSAALAVTRSVAASPKAVTASTGADKVSLASDGDVNTHYVGATPASVVYDFGKPVSIGGVRLAAKLGYIVRLRTMKIECADTSDFANARTLVEFVSWQDVCSKMGVSFKSGSYSVDFSKTISVASFGFAESVTARYFRIGRPKGPSWKVDLNGTGKYDDRDDGETFNFAEVEFSLADPDAVDFSSFSVGLDATTAIPYSDRTPIVSWNVGNTVASSFSVERGTSAEGPFFEVVADLPATTTSWADSTALIGVTYYYRVMALSAEAEPRAFYSSVVAYTPDRRLERDPSDLTKLRTGVTLIGDNDFWQKVARAFDGNASTMPCTVQENGASNWNYWPNPYVGVNLGESCRITGCLVISTVSSDWWGEYFSRLNKVNLYGTTYSAGPWTVDGRWPQDVNGGAGCTSLAEVRECVRSQWKYFPVSNEGSFRTVYLRAPGSTSPSDGLWATSTWAGNVSEFGIFGYSDAERMANYASLVTAPSTFTAASGANSVETSWNEGVNAAGYRVQRRPGGTDSAWVNVSANLAADVHAYTDTSAASLAAGSYEYRVVAIDGTGTDAGYSASAAVYVYPHADGTGLRASLVWPFIPNGYDDAEAVRSSAVATPTVAFAAGVPRVEGEPESTGGVRLVYEGKIVIPVSGTYQFRAVGTDGAAIFLDGHFVLNAWNASSSSRTTTSSALTLEAGEHAFRFDTWQDAGDRAMTLEWSVAGTVFEPIPASQLRPASSGYTGTVAVPLAKGTVETWGVRTFGQKELGFAASDAVAKSLTIAGYDNASSGNGLGQTAVFKKFEGPFEVSVKIDLPGSPDNPGVKGISSADADTLFFLTARTGFGAGTTGYGPYAQWYGWRGDARLGVGVLYKNATESGPDASGNSTSWWNYKPAALAADDAHDTWLRLRLVRDFDENGKTVFTSYFRKGSSGDWTLYSKWTDTDGLFGKDAYICLGASRKPHASLSADTTRFLVREIKCKPLHMGMAIILR